MRPDRRHRDDGAGRPARILHGYLGSARHVLCAWVISSVSGGYVHPMSAQTPDTDAPTFGVRHVTVVPTNFRKEAATDRDAAAADREDRADPE